MVKIPVRYVRNHCAGSTVNPAAIWTEIKVFRDGVNIALNILPTPSVTLSDTPAYITNGVVAEEYVFVTTYDVSRYVQIDLGQVYTDLENIIVWHYFTDGRTFRFVKTQVSENGTDWIDLFDSEIEGRYSETAEGKIHEIPVDPNAIAPDIKNIKLGNNQVDKIYVGDNISWIYEAPDVTAPITTPYPTAAVEYDAGEEVYFEVDETCFTYYTLDGSPVSEASTLYTAPIVINEDTVINYFSIDLAGNAETPKTVSYNIKFVVPTTVTISPTNTIQAIIPITITLTSSEGKAIYYRLGTGTQQTYTAPFSVNQSSAGVQGVMIPIYYWGEGETEQSITYDTTTAIAGKPVIVPTEGNNQVVLNWIAPANTTSYNVYRSTASGTLGTALLMYGWQTTYTDATAVNGTTYYYTVKAANYGNNQNSDQVAATPEAAAPSGWRYLKIEGYGASESGQEVTTRMVEVEAYVGETTNVLAGKTAISYEAISTGGAIATLTNGIKTTTGYPIWWTATPNADVVFDLGSVQALTSLAYYGYSTGAAPRTNRFKWYGSNTNNGADWVVLWDASANTVVQPALPNGYEVTI